MWYGVQQCLQHSLRNRTAVVLFSSVSLLSRQAVFGVFVDKKSILSVEGSTSKQQGLLSAG